MRTVNVLDPKLVGDYLSSQDGEQVFLNLLRSNADSIRTIAAEA
jgi:hypothetical protein